MNGISKIREEVMTKFWYKDPIYGTFEIPEFIKPLFHTELAVRARDITMGTVVNQFRVSGSLPSRFHHGVGAMRLALLVCNSNLYLTEDEKRLILSSALMHDWGNSPFAHLIERLMKQAIGHDGESFLEVLLDHPIGYSTKKALINIGVEPMDVVKMIRGRMKPFSDIIHGDMDVDNLDNIYRYAWCTGSLYGPERITPSNIAKCFKWDDCWSLGGNVNLPHWINGWKELRRNVYEEIYTAPHLVVATMIFQAAWDAYQVGTLTKNDFYKSDSEMVRLLLDASPDLMRKIQNWDWFKQVVNITTIEPSDRLKAFSGDFESRISLGLEFARRNKLQTSQVTIYAGPDKMERRINLPVSWYSGDTTVEELLASTFNSSNSATLPTTYRVHVNLDREVADQFEEQAMEFVEAEIL